MVRSSEVKALPHWLAKLPKSLQEQCEQREFKPGATLFHQGEVPCSIFCVLEGEIRLLRYERNGREVILQRSRSGFVAEASLEAKAYHCNAVAVTTSRLLCLPIPAFQQALDEDREFRQAWMTQLAREIRKLRSQCERLCLNNAADRIFHYIESEGIAGTIILDQSRKAWAAELGLTHETLYRTLRGLQLQGILQIESNRITKNR